MNTIRVPVMGFPGLYHVRGIRPPTHWRFDGATYQYQLWVTKGNYTRMIGSIVAEAFNDDVRREAEHCWVDRHE